MPPEVSTERRAEATPPVQSPAPADRGYPIDANIAPLVDVLNCLPGLGTFSSCGGHPPPLAVSQTPEGNYWINFCIDPWEGGWGSLQNLAYVVADMESVTIKIWLSGYEPDTIAFELAGVGDPLELGRHHRGVAYDRAASRRPEVGRSRGHRSGVRPLVAPVTEGQEARPQAA